MFKSATIRLTIWYLAILMIISLIFSAIIYRVAAGEVEKRLEKFQVSLQAQNRRSQYTTTTTSDDNDANTVDIVTVPSPENIPDSLRANEQEKARASLLIQLAYVNLLVLIMGGFSSYFLAKRHLRPIERAHAAQSRFTSDASHELRTPLAAMKAEIEVALKDKNPTISDLREILESNLEEVNKLTKLSSMLLNLSRMDNDKLKLEPLDLNKVVLSVAKDFGLPKSRLEVNKPLKHTPICGHEMAIFDLIKILLDNALKYSAKDSKIIINVSRQDDKARFDITNEGAGIQPDKLSHVFERFYRADESRTGEEDGERKGYGLGLALAKNIVDLHKGEIFAASTPGKTTTFTFLLPLNDKIKAKNKN